MSVQMINLNRLKNVFYRSKVQQRYASLYGEYVKFMTWATCGRKYKAEIDPFKLIYIEPSQIRLRRTRKLKQQFSHSDEIAEVKDGSWDNLTRPFEDNDMYRAFKAHFERGIPWEGTEFYRERVQLIEAGKKRWGCESKREFNERCNELDRLYKFINSCGYLTQRELREEYDAWPSDRSIHWYRPPELLEVTVNIDRHGQFIFHEGRNRMTIAKIVDIDKIPVRVKGRHKMWQQERDRLVEITDRSDKRCHPDLKYL